MNKQAKSRIYKIAVGKLSGKWQDEFWSAQKQLGQSFSSAQKQQSSKPIVEAKARMDRLMQNVGTAPKPGVQVAGQTKSESLGSTINRYKAGIGQKGSTYFGNPVK